MIGLAGGLALLMPETGFTPARREELGALRSMATTGGTAFASSARRRCSS